MKGLRGLVAMLQPAALFAPPVILGVMLEFGLGLLASPYNAQGGQLPLKSLLNFLGVGIAFAFLGIVYLAMRRLANDAFQRIVLLVCLPFGALLGGIFLGWARLTLGLDARSLLPLWMGSMLFHVTAVTVLLWLAVSGTRLHYERLDALTRDRDRLHALDLQAQQSLADLNVEATEAVRARILDGLRLADTGDPHRTVPTLTSTLEEIVRPLSRQLESQTQDWSPPAPLPPVPGRIDWKAAALDGLDPRLMSPFWTIAILNLLAAPMNLARSGVPMAVEFVLVSFCFAWPLFTLLRKAAIGIVGNARGSRRITTFIALCILCGLVIAAGLLPFTLGHPAPLRFVSLGPLFTLVVTFVWGFAVAAQHQARATEAALLTATVDLQWHIARSRELHRQRQRALAHAVHGQVQAALAAGILEIAAAVNADTITDDQVRDVHRRVIACVEELDLRNAKPSPLNVLLRKTQATWAGLAHMDMDVDPMLAALVIKDSQCLMTINDLIPELTFNSIKHGKATEIHITITRIDDRTVRLAVTDNGQSLTENASTGIGSRLLHESSITWHRTRMGQSTVTTADLPFAPTSMTEQFDARFEGEPSRVSP